MAGHVPTGMLRIPLTIQVPVATVDSFGQQSEAWVSVGTMWAHVETAQTSEVIDDRGPAVRTDWRILGTWHPQVSSRARLIWVNHGTTRTFNIRGCWDRDQRRRRVEIDATEVLA